MLSQQFYSQREMSPFLFLPTFSLTFLYPML